MDTLAFGYILPATGRIRDFHPLETCAARRTNKKGPENFHLPVLFFHFIIPDMLRLLYLLLLHLLLSAEHLCI